MYHSIFKNFQKLLAFVFELSVQSLWKVGTL